MDGDDVSHPERLRREIEVLSQNLDINVVETLFRTIDGDGAIIRGRDRSGLVQSRLLAPFAHGSIVYRRSVFERIGGYREQCDFWEDQDLYLRMARCGRVVVIPEALFNYRYNMTSTRLVSNRGRVEGAVDLGLRCLNAFAANGDYETELEEGPRTPVAPRAVVSVGYLELWAYRRPKALGRLFSHSRMQWDLSSLSMLLWAVWARVHPPSLRWASQTWARLRDAVAAGRVHEDRPYEWPLSRLARSPDRGALAESPSSPAPEAVTTVR
jgi:hypothetical protein